MRDLLDAGAHFGHQTHRWNPKMRPYIYGARHGIYIINLETTARMLAISVRTMRNKLMEYRESGHFTEAEES